MSWLIINQNGGTDTSLNEAWELQLFSLKEDGNCVDKQILVPRGFNV